MIKLIKYSDEMYSVEHGNEIIDANTYRAVYVMRELGYSFEMIESSLVTLLQQEHNVCEFGRGMYRTYFDKRYT